MILFVSPRAPATAHGNSVTAARWAGILASLGYDVESTHEYRGDAEESYEALVALHAGKSADSIRAFHARHPDRPIVLALTGTDLYPDLVSTGVDPDVLAIADQFVVLQSHGLRQLDEEQQSRTRVIVQSVPPIRRRPAREDCFEVVVLSHLRTVKDPLRTAEASRLLPVQSQVGVTHAGAGLDPELAQRAKAEAVDNPRYDWLGDLPRDEALDVLARSRLLVLTSHNEGGANVVSEALAAGVPVLSSKMPGSLGLLGDDYPGYFEVGDTHELADLLYAAETDRAGCYTELLRRTEALRDMVDPVHERTAWADLLAELQLPTR